MKHFIHVRPRNALHTRLLEVSERRVTRAEVLRSLAEAVGLQRRLGTDFRVALFREGVPDEVAEDEWVLANSVLIYHRVKILPAPH